MLTENKIREIFAESGRTRFKDLMKYLEVRHSGNYDKKVAEDNAKALVKEMKEQGVQG